MLGVYQVRATDGLIQDRIQYSYSEDDVKTKEGRAAAERECREFLESTVLVEVLIHDCDERFDVGEAFLTPDGEAMVAFAEAILDANARAERSPRLMLRKTSSSAYCEL